MSAFQVSDAHICALVTGAQADLHNMIPQPDWRTLAERFPTVFSDMVGRRVYTGQSMAKTFPDSLGRALIVANIDSVNARYPERADPAGDAAELLAFKHIAVTLEPASLIKQVHCYAYQASERDDWESCWAQAFCRKLETVTIARLPGYEAAPWGIK